MVAAIDKTEDGIVLAVYSERDGEAWHRLGAKLENGASLTEDFARMRALVPEIDPEYRKAQAYIAPRLEDRDGVMRAVLRHIESGDATTAAQRITDGLLGCLEPVEGVAFVRREDGRVLKGAVGEDSFGLPNARELILAAEKICEGITGAYLSFAGHLFGGSQFFVCVNLGDFEINGETHKRYLTLVTGLDGCKSREAILSCVRAVCANTVAWATSDAISATLSGKAVAEGKAYAKVKNTKNGMARFELATDAFRAILASFDKIKQEQEIAARVGLTASEAEKVLQEMLWQTGIRAKSPVDADGKPIMDPRTGLPVEASPQGKRRLSDCLARLSDPNDDAAGLKTPSGRVSLAQVWQSVTRDITHERSIKGAKDPNVGVLRRVEYQFKSGASNLVCAQEVLRDVIAERVAKGQVEGLITLEAAGVEASTGVSLDDLGLGNLVG